jgi:hypothetical protein
MIARPTLTASPAARARHRFAGRALVDQVVQREDSSTRGAVAIVRRAIKLPGHARRAAKMWQAKLGARDR